MPSMQLDSVNNIIQQYDVVGHEKALKNFIVHTGVVSAPGVYASSTMPAVDMAPPLNGPDSPRPFTATVVGRLNLSDDERQKLKVFLDIHHQEHSSFRHSGKRDFYGRIAELYCIWPHCRPFVEVDGRYSRTCFSCAGYVYELYDFARIRLVDLDSLPLVPLELIKIAYPNQFEAAEKGWLSLSSLGLDGEGPWPILLCGYLFSSLNRSDHDIRENALVADDSNACFPNFSHFTLNP